jgi:hypothetical protein
MKKAVFAFAALAAVAGSALASFSEGFEGASPGWAVTNASNPIGVNTAGWNSIPNATVWAAHSGVGQALANFNATSEVGTISAWLFSPVDTIQNGDTLKFWTRTGAGSIYPDRMQVRLSTNGASTNIGANEFSVGDFSTLLLDINPTLSGGGYPEGWTQFSITISGLGGPVSGRFAFRYFVEDGGPLGNNSNIIGLDDVEFTSIPAPGALALAGLLGLTAGRRRR